jgi:XTP/dITP diphosphohydrolase
VGGLTARLASRNGSKLRELQRSLPDWELELLDAELPPETGQSYYENALAKARFGHERAGGWVLGEDSGIEAEGLGGRPGLQSAREGGSDPQWLLRELQGVENRRARYVCELVAIDPKGTEHRGTGILTGSIADEARGSEGFGYDPVFVPDGEERTVAELGNEWKREHSHRARAAKALAEAIRRDRRPSPPARPRGGRGGTS